MPTHTTAPTRPEQETYRPDIDGMRSVAVLPVIAFHASLPWLPGGFVGVDIFFVISGYLISGIIYRGIERQRFSWFDFLGRRVRRLFPPLFVVTLATLAAGWFLFLPDEFWRLGRSAVATQLYASNILFWLEEDYFNGTSELKPLLHTWSLAVEEQFYIIMPLLLLALHRFWRRRTVLVLSIIAILSFVAAEVQLRIEPSGAFFLLHTRMWELLLGSILAI